MNTEVKLSTEPLNHPVLSLPRKAGAPVTPTREHAKVSVFDEMARFPLHHLFGSPLGPSQTDAGSHCHEETGGTEGAMRPHFSQLSRPPAGRSLVTV